jgi:type II secretory pathway component PulC
MSIIHDALKKVQQGLNFKSNKLPLNAPATPETTGYIYENPASAETIEGVEQITAAPQASLKEQIKSALIVLGAIVIILTSALYIYQQFQINIPQVQRMAKKSFYKLIHKEEIPDFKTKSAADLKPLAQVTLAPPPNTASSQSKPAAPITLNIHGIMSNDSGNLVLINDQVYQEGDEIDGAKITKINLDSITIMNNGAEQTILVKN